MNIFHVPLFVRAETPEELVQAMCQLNADNSITYKYFSMYFDGKNHIGWYHGDATLLIKRRLPKQTSTETLKAPNGRAKKS